MGSQAAQRKLLETSKKNKITKSFCTIVVNFQLVYIEDRIFPFVSSDMFHLLVHQEVLFVHSKKDPITVFYSGIVFIYMYGLLVKPTVSGMANEVTSH